MTWTFVTGTPAANQTQIGASLDATLTALASDLNGSADAQISKCTYTANTTDDRLEIQFDTAGTTGNSFTLAASANSNGTVSAATLTGGGYRHEWLSGGDDIPSFTFEIGHPKLVTPVFFRHLGTVMESLAFEMGQEGPANGTVQLVAQGEEKATATIDATPDTFALKRFSQGRGFIKRGGVPLAGVTGGSLTFSNNLERVRVIRDDGKIEAAEPTIATCTGAMTVRFDGATLVAEAANGDPVAVEYGFSHGRGLVAHLRAVPGVPAEAEVRRLRSRRRRGQLRLARRLRRERAAPCCAPACSTTSPATPEIRSVAHRHAPGRSWRRFHPSAPTPFHGSNRQPCCTAARPLRPGCPRECCRSAHKRP